MIIHIDVATGSPLFVVDQMTMISSIRQVYQKYGIHGIYYAVLYGWVGSPFYSITVEADRNKMVTREVYAGEYFDPVQKKQILPSEQYTCEDQYLQPEMREAIGMINSLARIPVVEDRVLYQKLLDQNKASLERQAAPDDYKGQTEIIKSHPDLFKNRKSLTQMIDEALKKEKEILAKSDPQISLNDFIDKVLKSGMTNGVNEVS